MISGAMAKIKWGSRRQGNKYRGRNQVKQEGKTRVSRQGLEPEGAGRKNRISGAGTKWDRKKRQGIRDNDIKDRDSTSQQVSAGEPLLLFYL